MDFRVQDWLGDTFFTCYDVSSNHTESDLYSVISLFEVRLPKPVVPDNAHCAVAQPSRMVAGAVFLQQAGRFSLPFVASQCCLFTDTCSPASLFASPCPTCSPDTPVFVRAWLAPAPMFDRHA